MFKRAYYFMPLPMFEGEGVGTPPAPGAPPPVDANAPWYQKAGVAPEHHEWLAGKEFADPSIAIQSHRSLEAMMGRNRLPIPNGPDDKEAYDGIYRTLGRPDKAEYVLPKDVKFQEDAWKSFQPIFHEAGLSQKQVDALTTAYHKAGVGQETAKETERAAAETRDIAALETEWGSSLDANKDIASRAFRSLGLDEATTEKIEQAIGYGATMKLFHNIGKGLSESVMHQDGTPRGQAGQTVDQLDNKISTLMRDPEFKARYNDPDPRKRAAAITEMEGLQKQKSDLLAAKQAQGAAA